MLLRGAGPQDEGEMWLSENLLFELTRRFGFRPRGFGHRRWGWGEGRLRSCSLHGDELSCGRGWG